MNTTRGPCSTPHFCHDFEPTRPDTVPDTVPRACPVLTAAATHPVHSAHGSPAGEALLLPRNARSIVRYHELSHEWPGTVVGSILLHAWRCPRVQVAVHLNVAINIWPGGPNAVVDKLFDPHLGRTIGRERLVKKSHVGRALDILLDRCSSCTARHIP